MKFLLDENADLRLTTYLIQEGHDARAIGREYPQSLSDEEVVAIAQREGRILITNDLDFGELVVRRHLPHAGVILFRLDAVDLSIKMARLAVVLREHIHELDHFLVVTERTIRVRHGRSP
jgi:predicted nuclease of predicted toxin-antitoxin system